MTLTATISPSAASGSVTFKDGGTTIATAAVSSGNASTTTSSLAVGAHTLTAEFASSNTANYTNSTSSGLSYTINSAGGGGNTSNASAVSFIAYSSGQPNTAVRRSVADTNYTVVASDTIIGYASLSAPRAVTLPSSNANIGHIIIVKDESGNCSNGNTITVVGTIDGATNYTLTTAYASTRLYAGTNGWYRITP